MTGGGEDGVMSPPLSMGQVDEMDMVIVESEVEIEVQTEPLYCTCQKPWDNKNRKFMIECDKCQNWFHGSCVGLAEVAAIDIDKYHCPQCVPIHGPTLFKALLNSHRHDYTDKDASGKPIQAGTPLFIAQLKEKTFLDGDEILVRMRGEALTLPSLMIRGFNRPILVQNPSGLDLRVPRDSFTVHDVERYVGSELMLELIDVQRQSDSVKMTMGEFAQYFSSLHRTNRYNLLSLEFSNTNLGKLVEPPYIARKLDWIANTWPSDSDVIQKPQVSKYCLIGTKDSYTDFHIDFGGTSVWYHVLWGEKIFYLIEPTPVNLALYARWMASTDQYESFFADKVSKSYRYVLQKGETLFIPTGWIHAVLTPQDSLVFGGNFLHSLNVDIQLKVYEIEKRLKTQHKYLFPNFEAAHWFAGEKFIDELGSFNRKMGVLPPHLYNGANALLNAFRTWNQAHESSRNGEEIPPQITPIRLIKDLMKEIKITRKRTTSQAHSPDASAKRHGLKTISPVRRNFSSSNGEESKNLDHLAGIKRKLDEFRSDSVGERAPKAPIKLKFKKQPSLPSSRASSPPPYRATSTSSSYENGGGDESSHNEHIKIRLSLEKGSVGEEEEESVSYAVEPYVSDSEPELRIDEDNEAQKRKKRKVHKNGKKGWNSDINAELEGTLVGINALFDESKYSERINSIEAPDSMKEALAGLMDIEGGGILSKKGRRGFDYEEDIEKVHQDEDFIYLPLAGGSDDEDDLRRSKAKKRDREDSSWNPRIKLKVEGGGGVRERRPARTSAKREAVEKGLESAAASLATIQTAPFKRKYKVKSGSKDRKHHHHHHQKHHSSSPGEGGESRASSSSAPPATGVGKKPKKGMATAKQRLGKILKIHKMGKF